jgi:glycosyltransferase involved in cell wall biosynthesis
MSAPRLTYVVNTFNKLAFLRSSLPRLLRSKKGDEEVIVVDGGSSDGTQSYVADLEASGHIDRFFSARDQGEAHGWNRGLLLASGDLVKLISDDDAYHFGAISTCRRFMEQTPEIDVLWTDGAGMPLDVVQEPEASRGASHFRRWLGGEGLLFFCGLGLMFRRSSLPLVGLFNTSSRRIDAEFALRVSSGPARQAWYTEPAFVRLQTSASNAVKFANRMLIEEAAFKLAYYAVAGRRPQIGELLSLANSSTRLAARSLLARGRRPSVHEAIEPADIARAFERADTWLTLANQQANDASLFVF